VAKIRAGIAKGKRSLKKAYQRIEARVAEAAGRRSLQRRKRVVGEVLKKAARAGAAVGAIAAAAVVAREVRKRRS
jgi:hypothetical protein